MSSTTFYNSGSLVGIGSVGIGTTNPVQPLELSYQGSSGHATLFPGNRVPLIGGGLTKNFLQIQCQDASSLSLGSNISLFTDAYGLGPSIEYSSSRHLFISNGSGGGPFVGIGVTNPQASLQVGPGSVFQNSPSQITKAAFIDPTSTNQGQVSIFVGTQSSYANGVFMAWNNVASGSTLNFMSFAGYGNDFTKSLVLTAGGYVGIGISTPAQPLHVVGQDGILVGTTTVTYSSNVLQLYTGATGAGYTQYSMNIQGYNDTTGSVMWKFNTVNNGTAYPNNLVMKNGNVGIGRTNPSAQLHVSSPLTNPGPSPVASFSAPQITSGGYIVTSIGSTTDQYASGFLGFEYQSGGGSSNTMSLGLSGTTAPFYVTGSGRVGIGAASPASILEIRCNDAYQGGICLSSAATNASASTEYMIQRGPSGSQILGTGVSLSNVMLFHSSNDGTAKGKTGFVWASSGSRLGMYFDTGSGNLGIGTTNPGCLLSFGSPTPPVTKMLAIWDGDNTESTASGTNFYGFGVDSGTLRYQVQSTGLHAWYQGTTQHMILDTAGRLGLGLSGPSYLLDLLTDGARKASTATWITGSDQRIKADIQSANLHMCYDVVKTIDLKYFKWNFPESSNVAVDDKHSLGFIAQEVKTVFPNAVSESNSYGFTDFLSLNTDQILKAMYGALKQTMADKEALEQSLISLEARIAALEAK
jgi:hypothetical protein